ncbi:hypothetical protein [Nocardiopsis composta]|uniref:Uncharacterized protein n=1 Tax=Nocardiopsis composta TaxID=157465 RepID=A0A7W8QJH5_9ACTN|nr:hypothetical protein [Nocardiopsis composta]MBB5431374.1 hypothetical protein [Nocardiopsis composta]
MADRIEDLADHMFDALAAAVTDLDDRSAEADVNRHLNAIAGLGHDCMLTAMCGWVAAAREVAGDLPAGWWGVAAVDAATGQRVAPEGRVPAPYLAAARIQAAVLNGDAETAAALWAAALAAGDGEDVVVLVLHQAAQAIRAHRS